MSRALVSLAVAFLLTNAAIWAQSYQGRVALHTSQVRACGRGRLDRIQNAHGWTIAERARRESAYEEHGARRADDLAAAHGYAGISAGLLARVVDCAEAFPPPSFWPHF